MKQQEDLVGKRFGRLVVREFSYRKNNNSCWICECDCGAITKPVQRGNLKKINTTSCGCYKKENPSRTKDIAGQVFGYLTAINPTIKRLGGKIIWECLCKCNNIHQVSISDLVSGNTTSCGCRIESKLHEKIRNILINSEIEIVEEEYVLFQNIFYPSVKRITLRVDFMIIYKNLYVAIEANGEQHYKSIKYWGGEDGLKIRQERDKRKREILSLCNIPLIEVKYDEKNIEEFLIKELERIL